MADSVDLRSLNPEQRSAVEHSAGPLLIFAGAGSGKTRVITFRIAKLIQDGVPPYRILAVTFTNKAAREMKERVEKLIGEEAARSLWIGTFHALCARILRIDGKEIGISPQFVIYDDADQISLIKDILKPMNIDVKVMAPRSILSEISRAKEKLLSPSKYAEQASSYFERTVAEIYKKYRDSLFHASALDFDDILYFTVRLFEQRAEVLQKYQTRFLHVMVDEYQDVNLAQYKIVQAIAAGHRNVMVVGDDDQSIYAWRGADVNLIRKFGSDFQDAVIVKLEQNYRSTNNILNAAYEVIRHNRGRADKRLWTDSEGGAMVTATQAGTDRDEAMLVIDIIKKDVGKGRRKFSDFAVLYRTNAQSRVFEESMITSRIPHVLIGGQRFYERKEIKDMVAYLRLVWNDQDNIAFKRIVNVPARGIGPTSIQTIEEFAGNQNLSMLAAVRTQELQSLLQKKAVGAIHGLLDAIDQARDLLQGGKITAILESLYESTGYLASLKEDHSQESAERLENLQELHSATLEFDLVEPEPSLGLYLERLSLEADVDSLQDKNNAVTLMTLHSAKGLEFSVVFLVGMEEGVFPHSRSLQDDEQLQEERRLAYVGMTRAKEELHLLFCQRRSLYGTPNFNRRSRFLDDIPQESLSSLNYSQFAMKGDPYDHQDRSGAFGFERGESTSSGRFTNLTASSKSPSSERGPAWKAPFQVGQQVKHSKFGVGLVIACVPVTGDTEVTVAFPGEVGVKKLVQKFAKLELV